jgi:hypothetical protein
VQSPDSLPLCRSRRRIGRTGNQAGIRRFLLCGLIFLVSIVSVAARDAREQQRIDYLMQSIGSLKGAVFIRNGTEYDAQAARAHLQTKLDYAGGRVKTAEQFVQYCASQSSISHQPYKIRFADGKVVETSVYFAEKLREFDAKNH